MLICIHLAIPQEFNDTRPKTLGEIWKGSPLAILWLTPSHGSRYVMLYLRAVHPTTHTWVSKLPPCLEDCCGDPATKIVNNSCGRECHI